MHWLRGMWAAARSGVRLQPHHLCAPRLVLRATAGLALAGFAGYWLFGLAAGVLAMFGGFMTGITTFQRSWRPDPVVPLVCALTMGATTFVGYLTSGSLPLFLTAAAVWTFLGGLCWSLGANSGPIALNNIVILLITVTLPNSFDHALGQAAFLTAGSLIQVVLVMFPPNERWQWHRTVLASALTAEADYARGLKDNNTVHFTPDSFLQAREADTLSPWQAAHQPAGLRGVRGPAEEIRPILASLADPAATGPDTDLSRRQARELLDTAATVLDAVAHAVRQGARVALPPDTAAALAHPQAATVPADPAPRAATHLRTLLHDLIEAANSPRPGRESTDPVRPPIPEQLRQAVRTLRGELRHDSPVLRHSLRSTVVVVAGYLIGHNLPLGHGYWVAMVAVLIMRPDFAQTYGRVASRFTGNLIGVTLASLTLALAHPNELVTGLLIIGCGGLVFLFMETGYAAVQAAGSTYCILGLGLAGESWSDAMPARFALTLLGGLLAMAAYALYPAWETSLLRERLAEWIEANLHYAAAVIHQYAEPAERTALRTRDAVVAARTARLAWEQALVRAADEPVRHRGLPPATAAAAGQAIKEAARITMLLEGNLPQSGTAPVPASSPLATALRQSAREAAESVRNNRAPTWEPVRQALADWNTPNPQEKALHHAGTLLSNALDDITTALDATALDTTAPDMQGTR
ncbi:FUSC family protein [Streptomyces sp. NBC_00096]|uniref:FUSC family protein n=1 Tax=Streptomyces sp. NBC_00096 TaxID=2975650 RepID=UPI0032562FDA